MIRKDKSRNDRDPLSGYRFTGNAGDGRDDDSMAALREQYIEEAVAELAAGRPGGELNVEGLSVFQLQVLARLTELLQTAVAGAVARVEQHTRKAVTPRQVRHLVHVAVVAAKRPLREMLAAARARR